MPIIFTGPTTDSFVQVAFVHGGDDGLKYFGTVLNTGGVNTLALQVVVTDYLGNTDTLSPTVAPGASTKFDTISFSFGSNTKPPFKTITISVKSNTVGSPTTYEVIAAQFS